MILEMVNLVVYGIDYEVLIVEMNDNLNWFVCIEVGVVGGVF